MRILIDTNIFISLEDSSSVLEDSFSEFVRLSFEHNHQIFIHPASLDDINRDTNIDRKRIILSRIRKYPILENPPILGQNGLSALSLKHHKDNDRVDNEILYAIYKDAVNILVTEDRGIHKKAKSINLEGRVHYIQQAAQTLRRLHKRVHISLPNISECSLHEIDLSDIFFDSLRRDYKGFNDWYKRTSRSGRKAWVYKRDPHGIAALLIYKEEFNEIISDDNYALPGKSLKLCTFKVGENIRGRKVGELFLKVAFRYATANKIEHIYITMRPGKHEFLEDLCREFGFYEARQFKGDKVFIKDHPIKPPQMAVGDITPLNYHVKYYPHYISDPFVGKYIVPIKPVYHGMLFPDNQEQLSIFKHSAVGNAIKQAYLCHAKIGGISSGDLLLFYRSRDWQAITSVGIVESVADYLGSDEIIQLVSKRTVYDYSEIVEMAKKKTKVILFRLAKHLSNPVRYSWLLANGVVNGPIQTIRKISDSRFKKIEQRI